MTKPVMRRAATAVVAIPSMPKTVWVIVYSDGSRSVRFDRRDNDRLWPGSTQHEYRITPVSTTHRSSKRRSKL